MSEAESSAHCGCTAVRSLLHCELKVCSATVLLRRPKRHREDDRGARKRERDMV